MKLLRVGPLGQERPALRDDQGHLRDLSSIVSDIDGAALSPAGLARIAAVDPESLPTLDATARIGACVARPGKFICVGLNFADHAAETNTPIPEEPILFMKATTAVCGPNDDIIQPRGSTKLDWEVELAFVVGQTCRYVSEADAHAAIAGYFVCHDVSERAFQFDRGGTWDKGKGCDTFGPIGPWLVTADEIADPLGLDIWLEMNGKRYQNGSTRTMIFSPALLVSYISQFWTLEPGDVVTTGTPGGIGMGQNPPIYLQPGDTVRLGIEHLGEQRQTIVAAR